MLTTPFKLLRTASVLLIDWAGKTLALLDLILQISRERRALARLSADQLRDIGVSPKSALRESQRGVFAVPANRLKRKPSTRARWHSAHSGHRVPKSR